MNGCDNYPIDTGMMDVIGNYYDQACFGDESE